MSTPYRILSLDGGGSWALIQVRCLQALFGPEARGHCILRQFDLVAANSGGSIVLAGLVADLPLSVILTVFETEANRRAIFSPTGSRFWRAVHRLGHTFSLSFLQVGPHYATERKLTALQAVLQGLEKPRPDGKGIATVCLEDVPAYVGGTAAHGPHFLIPTFDYNRQRSSFFRSDKASLGNTAVLQQALGGTAGHPHKGITLLEAVHACSTAPVNFLDRPACVKIHGQENHLWDGGVAGYNNPVLAAVTEALSNINCI